MYFDRSFENTRGYYFLPFAICAVNCNGSESRLSDCEISWNCSQDSNCLHTIFIECCKEIFLHYITNITSLDSDYSNTPTAMIIGITVGLAAIVFFLCLLCIIIVKKKIKKRSPAEGLQHNPQISLQLRSSQPFTINPSHQNIIYTEQQVPQMSTFKDTSFTSTLQQPPPPYGQFYQHFVGPIDPVSLNDVPSYPPPDYGLFSDQLSLASDGEALPDYDTVVSSTTTVPQESVQQEHLN